MEPQNPNPQPYQAPETPGNQLPTPQPPAGSAWPQQTPMQQMPSSQPETQAVPPLPMQTLPKQKTGKNLMQLLTVIMVAIVVIAAGVWLSLNFRATPDSVFNGYLANSLHTKSVTQTSSAAGTTGTILYDVSNVRDPKVSLSGNIPLSTGEIGFASYGDTNNDYLKITSLKGLPVATADNFVNKWVQLRKDGKWMDDQAQSLANFGEGSAHVLVLGEGIFGNFSPAEQKQLLGLMSSKKVYKYDVAAVTKAKVDGHNTFVYPVTLQLSALKELNKQAGKLMGITDNDVQDILTKLDGEPTSVRMYVRIDTKQLVKVTLEQSKITVTNTYTNYDATKLPAAPKAELSYSDFLAFLSGQ